MKTLSNILIIIFATLLSWLLSYRFGMLYEYFVPGSGGSFIDGTGLVGMPFAYVFFTPLFLNVFGFGKKNIWLTLAFIPAFLIYLLDIRHVYYPIIMGVVGWSLGIAINKLIKKLQTPDVKAKV